MSIGTVLEVGIGLIFVFLLLGLAVSALQEAVSALLGLRSKYLLEGISTILRESGNDCWLAKRHILPWSNSLDQGSNLFKKVADHALVTGITPSTIPSYVPAENFALALIDVLKGAGSVGADVERSISNLSDGPAKQALRTLFSDADKDLDEFKKNIESWFNGAMDRVSGVYKRWTQYFTLIVGCLLAVALNANTIEIAGALWQDPALRQAAVAAAEQYIADCHEDPANCPVSEPSSDQQLANTPGDTATKDGAETDAAATDAATDAATTDATATATSANAAASDDTATTDAATPAETATDSAATDEAVTDQATPAEAAADAARRAKQVVTDVRAQLTEIGYPIGWKEWPKDELAWITAILGWLITGLAVSLGAPFWFDMLKRFVNVRGAGANPKEQPPAPQPAAGGK